ncbi:MAG: nitrilase-related carbon-nitrogen hydrolase, partial [Pseudomonadota bacterium]|nr:nitrilase-related carbon-nitrogen hydrolase [Pseudomonadota bacterium]
ALLALAVPSCGPVGAPTRCGHAGPPDRQQSFYGHSFISDEWGDLVSQFGADQQGVLLATLDLERAKKHRAGMGFFRDRRPQLYGRIAEDI